MATTDRQCSTNPTSRGRRFPPEVLTASEVKALLAACSARAPTGVRNRALIATLYRSGLRLGEAIALLPKDIDPAGGTIAVLHGKGDRSRVVGIDPLAMGMVQRWLDVRARVAAERGWRPSLHPIFCTLRGEPIKQSYVRDVLPRLRQRAGIAKRVHAHGLRHTHAAELAVEGKPMNLIQAQLGHSSLATTDRYLRHIAPAELIRAIQAREWSF